MIVHTNLVLTAHIFSAAGIKAGHGSGAEQLSWSRIRTFGYFIDNSMPWISSDRCAVLIRLPGPWSLDRAQKKFNHGTGKHASPAESDPTGGH